MTTNTPAPIPKGSLLTTGQILSLERRSNMTDDEALRFARAIESALLSKLRAEGVQAGDEAEAFEAWLYLGQTQFEPSDLNKDAISLAQLAYSAGRAAPVASAPADERAALEAWAARTGRRGNFKLRDGDGYADGYANSDWHVWQARSALASAPVVSLPSQTRWPVLRAMSKNYTSGKHVWDALDADACEKGAEEIQQLRAAISKLASAPVAGEAQPVAWMHQCRKKPELTQITMKKHEPSLAAKGYRPVPLYDAPQASEAVRDADVSALLSFIFGRFGQPGDAGELPDTVVAAVRRLERAIQPQADKDGCTCPSGDGSLRHPCPMHPGADKDGGQQKYWLCCGSKDPYHGNRRAPDCFNTTTARWGTADEHSKDARAALSATQTEQGEREDG